MMFKVNDRVYFAYVDSNMKYLGRVRSLLYNEPDEIIIKARFNVTDERLEVTNYVFRVGWGADGIKSLHPVDKITLDEFLYCGGNLNEL